MKKITTIVLLVILVFVFVLEKINPVWFQDIKLKSTRVWGLATIENNPLLPSVDADLGETDYKEKEVQPRINLDDLLSGGPPKDGIPSIDNPKFENISETNFTNDELIIGLVHNGVAKAYPYAILNWHEVVNDYIGETPVVVTYCPLCETNSVFIRELDNEVVEFGVSGKLYNSCLVMYDRKTQSLYAQPWGLGIVGEKTNHVLERLPVIRTTVGQFANEYPDAQILTTDTGYSRNYEGYPYGSYYTNDTIIFPARNQKQLTEHPKEITQVIFNHNMAEAPEGEFIGEARAFTQKEVHEATDAVEFAWRNHTGVAEWSEQLGTIIFRDNNGIEIPNMALFNFVYPAYFK